MNFIHLRMNTAIGMIIAVLIATFPNAAIAASPTDYVSAKSAGATSKTMLACFKTKVDDLTITRTGVKLKKKFNHIPVAVIEVTPQMEQSLKNHPNLSCLEENITFHKSAQTADWGIESVKAPQAWTGGITGKGIKIAIIDTGIATHEDLAVSGGVSFTGYTTSFSDDNGHGTHVAGIIGARNNSTGIVGVAPEASLYAVKVLDNTGSGTLDSVVSGIDWAISNGMQIINMSLGSSSGSSSLQSAVDRAFQAGILVVAAGGNHGTADGSGDTVEYPARYPSVIAVSAIDSTRNRASFSATGTKIEIAAPGVNVLSTYMNNQYAYMSGTSMASPYAAGLLALIKQANPTFSASALRAQLQKTAIDLGTSGLDAYYGYGLGQAPVPTIAPTATPTVTSTPVPTIAPTATPAVTSTPVPTIAPTATPTVTSTPVPTITPTATPTVTSTPVPTIAPTATPAVTSTPVPTVAPKLTATGSTNKYSYFRGETVSITANALSSLTPIDGASVTITIINPKNAIFTGTSFTNTSGKAYFSFATSKKSLTGVYRIQISISKPGYQSASATGSFSLK